MVGKLAVVVVEPRYRLSLPEVKKNDWLQVPNVSNVSQVPGISVSNYVIFVVNKLLKSGNFLYVKKTIP